MASARAASLQAQRSGYNPYGSSGRIRILAPSNNSIASIAKKTATNELNVMVARYNNGEISNEDMRNFLTKMGSGIGLSDADKLEVQTQIKDFDSRIVLEKLTANYKSAPDNSLAQLQAAQAIASYHNERAAGQQPGTPAQSTSLQNAADWNNRALDVKSSINKVASQNLRYREELKVNAISDNTSEQAQQKASMWQALYDKAVADGDEVGANKYAAYYQDAITKATDLATSESTKANKKQLTDFINTTLNDYHDGKISGEQALASLEQANQFAYDAGDTAALNRLNGLSITINREIDKGITYSSVNGLSTKSKGGGTGGSDIYLNPDGSISAGGGASGGSSKSGTKGTGTITTTGGKTVKGSNIGGSGDRPKTLTELEVEYKNNLNEANRALVAGEIPAVSKNPKDKSYTQFVLLASKERQVQLANIQEGLDELSAQGIKKIAGKNVEELRKSNSAQLTNVTAQYNQIKSGNLVLAMKSSDFTDSVGNKSSKPVLSWIPKAEAGKMVNANGVYHGTREELVSYTDRKQAQAYAKDKSTDGNALSVVQDGTGAWTVVDANGDQVKRKLLDIQDTAGNSVTYEADSKYGWLPQAVGPRTGALRQQMVKEFDAAAASNKGYQQNLMGYSDINKFDFKTPVGQTQPLAPEEPTAANKVVNAIKAPIAKVVEAAKVAPPQVPMQQFNPSTQLVPSSMGSQPAIRTAPSSTTLKLATQAPSPVAKLAQSTGQAPKPIAAPNNYKPISNATFNKQAEEARKKANNPVGTVINKIKSLFK